MKGLVKKIVSYPRWAILTTASIIVILLSLIMWALKAPNYIILFFDIVMAILIVICDANYKVYRFISKSKGRICYYKDCESYYQKVQRLTGETIFAYHPTQDWINIDNVSPGKKKKIKRIYDDIKKQIIREYHMFLEVEGKEQLEALMARIEFLRIYYPDLIENKNVPIWVRKHHGDDPVLPFHSQLTMGRDDKYLNFSFGRPATKLIHEGVTFENNGDVYHVFYKTVTKFIKSKFEGRNVTDGNINKDMIISLCNDFSVPVPEYVEKW